MGVAEPLTTYRKAFDTACRVWSRDDFADHTKTMKLGEAMMFAATDLIETLEAENVRLKATIMKSLRERAARKVGGE